MFMFYIMKLNNINDLSPLVSQELTLGKNHGNTTN